MKNITLLILLLTAMNYLTSCGKKTKNAKPELRDITETVFASGVLVPDHQYNLTAQSEGQLVEVNFDEGDTVKADAVLAIIENESFDYSAQASGKLLDVARYNASEHAPALKQLEASIKLAEQKLKEDELQLARYKKLYESKSVSKLEYENTALAAATSKTNLESLEQNYKLLLQQSQKEVIAQKTQDDINKLMAGNNKVIALEGGRIYNKYKQAGDYVRKGEVIAVIGNLNNLYAKLSIDETSITKIKSGQDVVIQLNTAKGKNYKGKVTEVYPWFDERTQSFYCRVEFTDKMDFSFSGTQLQANIIIANRKDVLVIPREFLGYGNKVLTADNGEVEVETGFVSNEWVEIKKGIDLETTVKTHTIK